MELQEVKNLQIMFRKGVIGVKLSYSLLAHNQSESVCYRCCQMFVCNERKVGKRSKNDFTIFQETTATKLLANL